MFRKVNNVDFVVVVMEVTVVFGHDSKRFVNGFCQNSIRVTRCTCMYVYIYYVSCVSLH